MAGIGFELQKVLRKGGVSSVFKAALAGIIIVAGPWLLSIIGIFFLYRVSASALLEGGSLFTAVIVYSYAFSLSIFGGIHYIFTRYISDLIYIKKQRRAFGSLLLSILGIAVLSGIPAVIAVLNMNIPTVAYPFMFKASAVVLFVTINLIWLVMIYITLLKRYMVISFIYLGGMVVSIFAAMFLGNHFLLSGALAGFCTGQVFILLLLLLLIFQSSRPSPLFRELRPLLGYFGKYRFLLLTGIFYSAGIWIDKIILWNLKGATVYGTFIKLFADYDMSVYLANLTIIPGLVYFMIFSESNYFIALKRLLLRLSTSTLSGIAGSKHRLLNTVKSSITEEALFQGTITFVLIILAPVLQNTLMNGASTVLTLRITLGALFFNLLFLTSMTFLFYLEKYKETFIAALLFFSVNFGATLYGVSVNIPFYGAGYLAAGAAGVVCALVFLYKGVLTFDQKIFSQF